MNRRIAGFSLAFALFVTLFSGPPRAHAQNVYASIHGTVTDPSGAVVPGAKVTVTNTSTGIVTTQTTNNQGYYILPQLAIGGPYSVKVDAPGFQGFQSNGVQLSLNENLAVDAKLSPGAVAQTVQVSANAVQVDTSDTQLKTTVGSTQIEQLPLLGRDATVLQKLTPGTVEASDRFGGYSSNGSQTQQNSYLLDGADVNDVALQDIGFIVNPDALSEITFVTSTQNPQYSRNSGAIVNETIKSGTNRFHGNGFEFYRDTFLNNRNYFSTTRPAYHQNLFGGTLGGPVIKNKLFFFLAYQGFRRATGRTTLTAVPTDAQLGRNGSGYADLTNDNNVLGGGTNAAAGLSGNPIPFAIQGPNGVCAAGTPWNSCFSGGTVHLPTSDFNSISANMINQYVPAPNQARGGKNYYNFNAPNSSKADQGIIRIDAQATHNDQIWADGIFQSNPSTAALPYGGATLPGFTENDARHIKIFTASWTHTFNPTTLNELRAGYYRFNYASVEPAKVVQPSSLGFAINPQDASAASVPTMSVTGFFTLGFSPYGPQPRLDDNVSYGDNFTKILGNHNVQLGAQVERFGVKNPYFSRNNGAFSFNGSSGSYTSGDPLLDFLVGIPSSYLQGSGAQISARAWEIYGYAQDNWKVSPSFTLNYGIGYDIQTPFENLQYGGKAVICFTPGAQSKVFPTAQPSLLYPGDPGCNNRGGTTAKYDHFAPRIGFDWSPDSNLGFLSGTQGQHQLAIRGGVGVYFNRDSEEAQLQNLEDPPFGTASNGAADVGGSPSFANPFMDASGDPTLSEPNKFPYAFPKPGQSIDFSLFAPYDISTISPKYNVPYAFNFNLNIERQLPGSQVLTIGYVGSLGRHLIRAYEANRITPSGHAAAVASCDARLAAGKTCSSIQTLLPLIQPGDFTEPSGNFLSVGQVYTDGSSSYNSLQVSLAKQTTHGLYYQLSYTWSHALDNGSSFESAGFGNSNDLGGTIWVPGYQQLSYGNSEYDARHRFVAAYGYVIPLTAGMKQHYLINEALGGWHISGITALQSGYPVSIGEQGLNQSLYCNSAVYSFYACPDTPNTTTFDIHHLNPRSGGNYWFDGSVFSPQPIGTFGNVKRNFFSGPGFNYTDMNLFKDFPLGHTDSPRYIELRLEAFNLFNHANFDQPDGNLTDGAQFGQITSVIQPVNPGDDPQPARAIQLAGKVYF